MPHHNIYIPLETGKHIAAERKARRPFPSFDRIQFSQQHSFLPRLEEICLNHSRASKH